MHATTFDVSDVTLAKQALREIPYPHAISELIDAKVTNRELNSLNEEISFKQETLASFKKACDEPLPWWIEEARLKGFPEDAEAEVQLKQSRVVRVEAELTSLINLRVRLLKMEKEQPTIQHGIEACSRFNTQLVAGVNFHPMIATLHLAFHDHRPLSLSPDMIWLLISQGVANHINAKSETLRPRFVQHQGKLKLEVRRDDFIKGVPENPWHEVFPAFTNQIRTHVGEETHDFFVAHFSTTGAVEKAAFELVLMDAMQSYFTYVVTTICGIPRITLEGSSEDWRNVLQRAQMLKRFDMDWWLEILHPLLEQFINAKEGTPDVNFWQSIYKYQSVSGGAFVTGWITSFFPYLKNLQRNSSLLHPNVKPKQVGGMRPLFDTPHIGIDQFPAGLSKAPLCWDSPLASYKMHLIAGFIGVRQDAETLCLRPEVGWAVCDSTLQD